MTLAGTEAAPFVVAIQLLSRVRLFATPWTAACQASLSHPSHHISQGCSNSCPSSQWCYPTISSSVIPLSSCLQAVPASGSFPMSRLFSSGSQSIGASGSTAALLMNSQGWFPLEINWFDLLAVQGTLKVFSSIATQKHQVFRLQPSLWSNSHLYMTIRKITALTSWTLCWQSDIATF